MYPWWSSNLLSRQKRHNYDNIRVSASVVDVEDLRGDEADSRGLRKKAHIRGGLCSPILSKITLRKTACSATIVLACISCYFIVVPFFFNSGSPSVIFGKPCAVVWREDGRCDINPWNNTAWGYQGISRAGCNPYKNSYCCGPDGYCHHDEFHCARHNDTGKVMDFRQLIHNVPKRFIVPSEIANELKKGFISAHPVLDDWLAPLVFRDYMSRKHVADQGYDSKMQDVERFFRPWDETPRSRPRCGPLFDNRKCRHARCCSLEGYCGEGPSYCTDMVLHNSIDNEIFDSKHSKAALAKSDDSDMTAIAAPFDSGKEDFGSDQPAHGYPFYCMSWFTMLISMHKDRALTWVKGQPMHSFRQSWQKNGKGFQMEDLWDINLMQDLSFDLLYLQTFDLRRAAGTVLLRFARERDISFDEIIRVESWKTRIPSAGIIDAAFWQKTSREDDIGRRIVLSFDFTHNVEEQALPQLKLRQSADITRVVFVIASFGRKRHLQRLLRQINVLERADNGRTSACIAGQTNDPAGMSLEDQVSEVITFDHARVINTQTNKPFNKALNLQNCIDVLEEDDIAFVMDVDLKMPKDISDKARRYTRKGSLVYSPIIWYQVENMEELKHGKNPEEQVKAEKLSDSHTPLLRVQWQRLAVYGPGIIAFYVSDGRTAGGYDTISFVEHGFEDTDFYFRLKQIPGMDVARVIERGLVHIWHKPSLNNINKMYRMPLDAHWRNLKRKKCPYVTQSRHALETLEESNSVVFLKEKYTSMPEEWEFHERSESDIIHERNVLPSPVPLQPLMAYEGHQYANLLSTKRLHSRMGVHPGHKNTDEEGTRIFKETKLCTGNGVFCMDLRTHARIDRNTKRIKNVCLGSAKSSPYNSETSWHHQRRKLTHTAFWNWDKLKDVESAFLKMQASSTRTKVVPTSLLHPFVGSISETGALFAAKIRCNEPFSLSLLGEKEKDLLQAHKGTTLRKRCGNSITEANTSCTSMCKTDADCAGIFGTCFENVSIDPCVTALENSAESGNFAGLSTESSSDLLQLNAAWVGQAFSVALQYDNFHIGLPFAPCVESRDYSSNVWVQEAGGSDPTLLDELKPYIDRQIPRRQFTYTNQWRGLLNRPSIISLLQAIEGSGTLCIFICDDDFIQTSRGATLPIWVSSLLSIPLDSHGRTSGGKQRLFHLHASMLRLAKRAIQGIVFLFASKFSGALIPMMTQVNKANFYIDIGAEGASYIFETTDSSAANSDSATHRRNRPKCTESRWTILERRQEIHHVYAQCPSTSDEDPRDMP